ncbi:hypothetical protein [Antarctobacter heliothermus]|uniref:hypothetical protein n=1 Tax=Antarctobacter heliothermus TaxID=74033 RepID=UPI0020C7D0F2|nr:hypothetical protein [Antarctobacter heliothermus]|tara:strand:+ start:5140 stop:5610 length:471 start_codon:yes stop_codon:yes gene_type:complete
MTTHAFPLTALYVATAPAAAKDLLVVVAEPGNLYVFDTSEPAVIKERPKGTEMSPSLIQMTPDDNPAYVPVNRWQEVIGIDIKTCEKVFYVARPTDEISRRSIGSLAVAADGSENSPTKKLIDCNKVVEPEFAVYAASGGLETEPVRTYPARAGQP